MSCYFRHMKDIMTETGIDITRVNKKKVDQAIHHIVGIEYKNCSATWKTIKQEIMSDEKKRTEFINKLKLIVK
jgi:hypothetical protein